MAPNHPNNDEELSDLSIDELAPQQLIPLLIDTSVQMVQDLIDMENQLQQETDEHVIAALRKDFNDGFASFAEECDLLVRFGLMTQETYQEILDLVEEVRNMPPENH